MPLETALHIASLVATNPAGADDLSTADDHIRLLKDVLIRDLPLTTAATALGISVLTTASTSAARTALGSTATGDAVFIAATSAAARTALGSTATGDAVFIAATANAGADALGAFRRGTLLGTVSQTAGVPTGAVVERGSNANGEYVRFADGTQICTASLSLTNTTANVAVSTAYTFAAAFVVAPGVVVNIDNVSAANDFSGNCRARFISASGGQVIASLSVVQTYSLTYVAIGRWF